MEDFNIQRLQACACTYILHAELSLVYNCRMKCIEVQAHAKVNLILNVLGKRSDGYHEIESVMQTIDLHDRVEICCTEEGSGAEGLEISLDPGSEDLPSGPDNLAYKAALLMYREFREGARLSIRLRIDKRIPAAAGLGGGSADAAAVLYGLARLWDIVPEGYRLHPSGPCAKFEGSETPKADGGARLFAVAKNIGSDVPFCLASQFGYRAAIARGRGEKLEFIEPLKADIITYTPPIEVSTAAVYAALHPEDMENPFDLRGYLQAKSLKEKCKCLGNQLQAPAARLFPEIKDALHRLSSIDDALRIMQSGSGPTVLAVLPPGSKYRALETVHSMQNELE